MFEKPVEMAKLTQLPVRSSPGDRNPRRRGPGDLFYSGGRRAGFVLILCPRMYPASPLKYGRRCWIPLPCSSSWCVAGISGELSDFALRQTLHRNDNMMTSARHVNRGVLWSRLRLRSVSQLAAAAQRPDEELRSAGNRLGVRTARGQDPGSLKLHAALTDEALVL